MDFQLDENQTQIRDAIEAFCRAEIEAQSQHWDEDATFPDATFGQLADLGMLGVYIPESQGGVGLGLVELATVLERVGYADAGLAAVLSAQAGACAHFLNHPALIAKDGEWLSRSATGQLHLTWASRERIATTEAQDTVTAVATNSGHELCGSKYLVVGAQRADIMLVTALLEGVEHVFAVERSAEGMVFEDTPGLGLHSGAVASLHFDHVEATHLDLGTDTARHIDQTQKAFQICLAAVAAGVGARAVDLSAAYALERKQFGKPIAEFQAIQHRISDATTGVDAARLLMWRAASEFESGRDADAYPAMAYTATTQAAFQAGDHGIQIHGGYGYVREYTVERLWRDARVLCTLAGSHSACRDLIGRHSIG